MEFLTDVFLYSVVGIFAIVFIAMLAFLLFAIVAAFLDCLGIAEECGRIFRTWIFGYDPKAKKEGRSRMKNYD
jgi:hypothetical protein